MSMSSKEYDFNDLLEAFKTRLTTMDRKEIVRLSVDLAFIRYYMTALSMKDLLTPAELEELLAYLQEEIMKHTSAENEVLNREMVQ
jgi:hypothetical protein